MKIHVQKPKCSICLSENVKLVSKEHESNRKGESFHLACQRCWDIYIQNVLMYGQYPICFICRDRLSNRVYAENQNKYLNQRFQRILALIHLNPRMLRRFNHEFRNHREWVVRVIQQTPQAFRFFDEELRNDPSLLMEAIRQNPLNRRYMSQELKKDDSISRLAAYI